MTMKIGLLGYGKSGKVTAAELQETHDVELKWILKKEVLKHRVGNIKAKIYGLSEVGDVASFLDKNEVDAVIDFSHKSSINLYPAIIASGTKIVSTISNYGQEEKDILNECARQGSILYAPNITIGINVILQISRQVQKIVPDAAIKIKEVHFEGKKEMSATAKKIADTLKVDQKAISVEREGDVIGIHEVNYRFGSEEITLIHKSHERKAFATGSIAGVQWLKDKASGLYNMQEVINDSLKSLF